ncbi:S8 family serine peptidase [Rhodocytophaga aerolata]|uniref:S8 family serine peptidase n=1 Tax=Rhodocytophaga aerolata TaxID=455078 RepID=A0ABT8RGW5_9BACT|nr:S8 family serine peptidase [Rhodocytophaga aerolata]MDO1450594.1 S8 family serine peptidase [Rhodocytophaga aerolata]
MKRQILLRISTCIYCCLLPIFLQAQVTNNGHSPSTTNLYLPNQLIVKFRSPVTTKGYRTDDASFRSKYAAFKQLGVRKTHKLHPDDYTTSTNNKLKNLLGARKKPGLSLIYQIELDSKADLMKAIELLKSQPDVVYAEPVYQHFPLDVYTPNDPQAHANGQYYLSEIKAFEAWALEKGNPAVTIGVVDYGFIPVHEDLAANIQYNLADPVDGKDNDKDGYIDNYAGWNVGDNNNNLYPATGNGVHGTWTSGIAAAVADNGKGIAGTGLKCKFMPVKGEGIRTDGVNYYSVFYGYAGLLYAAKHGSKVINLSWGRPGVYSQYEEEVINFVVDSLDVVIVAAAGNDNNEVLYWPASYDKVISVAGTDYENRDQRWQSYDPAIGSNYNDKVDICAPSEYILTSSYYNPADANSSYTYYYDARSGTSMAAPQVSAAAALVRSKFPGLSAMEVKNRLLATADNIDASNPDYVGKLGRGRLNIYKALTDEASMQAIALEKFIISNQQRQPFLLSGDSASIALYLKSLYGNFNNLHVQLSSSTKGVTITKPAVSFTPLTQGNSVNNLTNAFQVKVDKGLAASTQAIFKLVLMDGSFSYTTYFKVIINPDYLTIQNNQVSLTLGNTGRFGFNDDFLGWTQKGSGFVYKGNNLLFEGGLLLGTGPTQVSNSIMNQPFQNFYYGNSRLNWEIGKDNHFTSSKHFDSFSSTAKDIEVRNTLVDTVKSKNPNPIGVTVAQRSYTWHDDKFIILEYQITNSTKAEISSVYAGISANFDIQGSASNMATWDEANKLCYMYNQNAQNIYAGVQLLTTQTANCYIIDHKTGISLINDFQFTSEKKYTCLSSGIFQKQSTAGASDVQQTVSAQVTNLKPGETRIVAFAFLAGDNLADLQASAAKAFTKFTQLKTSPLPVITQVEVCKDDEATIIPQNGRNFNLYTSLPLTEPVATGSTFPLGKATTDSSYYITSIDSLYESEPVAVQVKALSHATSFNMSKDTLGLYEGDKVQLTDNSTEATRWKWYFGDNSTSDQQNPTHQYTHPGKYTIKLVTENKIGCRDSLQKEVLVVNGIKSLPPVVSDKLLCNGEPLIISPTNGTNFHVYASLPFTTPIASGSTFNLGSLRNDTVFFVTNTDFLLESEPVKVTVLVSNHTAKFESSADTLDLRLLQQLQLTDKSKDATQWLWTFGDGEISTEKNPAHLYALPGEYTITLVSRNNEGCQSIYAQKIIVTQTTGLEKDINRLANLFPNPALGKITLLVSDAFTKSTSEVILINVLGQQVYQTRMHGSQVIIDVAGFARGPYVVQIKADGRVITKKLLLQ